MIAEIITVGTEITTGSTLNTNSQYLSNKLLGLGIETYYHTSVDDDSDRLSNVLEIALNRADIIITTGGLGPTEDDFTKEVVSKSLGLKLEVSYEMEAKIENMFLNMNRIMTDNNRKQATKPCGSQFIENTIGTAPGIFIKWNKKIIIMLPGPPREMKLMFEKGVTPLIKKDFFIIKKSINTIGIGESALETQLLSMDLNKDHITITTFAGEGSVEIKIIGKGKNKKDIENNINSAIKIIEKNLKEYIYGYDNISIEESIINLLKSRGYRLGLCESCTGGLISSKITSVPGASSVLDRAIVSYSNNSKIEELGVSKNTLEKYGAVSRETAYEMAKGLLKSSDSLDIVLSITGIAGPDGGTFNKPVGLVYICIMTKDGYEIVKANFNGNRSLIQNRAAIRALDEIRKTLLKINY